MRLRNGRNEAARVLVLRLRGIYSASNWQRPAKRSWENMPFISFKTSRYLVALIAVASVLAARFLLESILGDVAPLLLFTLAVMVAAWYGGLGPGLVATLSSVIVGE